ncbi:MAG: hypothetical protein D4S01_04120 [Dehalococcoidia bacterium]|nr:MAG: hypothetical protein D4S01_04120 [Dehalococcoidia bacterium]
MQKMWLCLLVADCKHPWYNEPSAFSAAASTGKMGLTNGSIIFISKTCISIYVLSQYVCAARVTKMFQIGKHFETVILGGFFFL